MIVLAVFASRKMIWGVFRTLRALNDIERMLIYRVLLVSRCLTVCPSPVNVVCATFSNWLTFLLASDLLSVVVVFFYLQY